MMLEDAMAAEDERRRKACFSELLLRHLVTGAWQKYDLHGNNSRISFFILRSIYNDVIFLWNFALLSKT